MKKWERLVEQTINSAGATVIKRLKVVGHLRLMIQIPNGDIHKIVVSSSPRIAEHALNAIEREVKKLL